MKLKKVNNNIVLTDANDEILKVLFAPQGAYLYSNNSVKIHDVVIEASEISEAFGSAFTGSPHALLQLLTDNFSKAGASASPTGRATTKIKIDYKGVASSFTVFKNHRFYGVDGEEIAPENFVLLSKSEYVMRGEIGRAIKTQNLEVTTNKSANIVFSCAGTAPQRYVFDARQNVDSLNINSIKITFEDDGEQNLPIYRRYSNNDNLIILQ